MLKFYFNDKEKLEQLNTRFIATLGKYNQRDYDTEKVMLQLLDETGKIYHERGYSNRENQAQTMKAELATALRGIHPVTLEKVAVRRNEMQMTIVFKLLSTLGDMLRTDLEKIDTRLDEARQLTAQIFVAALQTNLLDTDKIKKIKTQQQIENMWDTLSADANIALGQKRVLLLVSRFDVLLLCEELITQLKQ